MTVDPGAAFARRAFWSATGRTAEDIAAAERVRIARQVECAHCEAKPWDRCSSLGAYVDWVHPCRMDALR